VATRPKKPKPSNHDELVERLEHIEGELHEMTRRLTALQLHFDQFSGAQTTMEMLRELLEGVRASLRDSGELARTLREEIQVLTLKLQAEVRGG
jgi:23S rRNA C2498 (ribose-2'-O)-methylase RlmM